MAAADSMGAQQRTQPALNAARFSTTSRAKKILGAFKGGVGAYTDSRGNPLIREEVAKFFEDRDGMKSCPDVRILLQLFCPVPRADVSLSVLR